MATTQRGYRRILKYVIGIVIVLVLLGVIGVLAGWLGGGDSALRVDAEEVQTRNITQVVTAFGRVQPELEVKISPDVSGEIVDLRVEEGDEVRAGDLLATLRPDYYSSQVDQAEASLKQARAAVAERAADLKQAEATLRRQRDLHERNVISGSDLEQAETTREIAEASHQAALFSMESAEARLREAGDELSRTRIYAPMDGTVSMLEVELGERVVGTMQQAGTEMMRIARLDRMELEVDVNENDVINVSLGDSAAIEIDAHTGRTYRGVVTRIANSARISGEGTQDQVTNFPVKVRLIEEQEVDGDQATPQAAPLVRPGMSGTVDIFTHHAENVLAVPIQAVTVRELGDSSANGDQRDLQQVVFVENAEGLADAIRVETGIADDTYIEITSGLEGSERIITGPYSAVSRELNEGIAVRSRSE